MRTNIKPYGKGWVVGIDADDTLWHWERHFKSLYDALRRLENGAALVQRLAARERFNASRYGSGINAFLLSMVESLIESGHGATLVAHHLRNASELLFEASRHPVLMPGVVEVLGRIVHHPLFLITRGDIVEQSRKLESSGLARWFCEVIVVPDKSTITYSDLLQRHGVDPARFIMVGNSIAADVLPVLQIGGVAVLIPQVLSWPAEDSPTLEPQARFHTIPSIMELPCLLEKLTTPS